MAAQDVGVPMAARDHRSGGGDVAPAHRRTWKATIGGVFILIPGILGLVSGLFLLFKSGDAARSLPQQVNIPITPGLVIAAELFLLGLSLVVLAGGVAAIRRHPWWLALAGGILAILLSGLSLIVLLPLIATILVAFSRREFVRRQEYVAERRLTGA